MRAPTRHDFILTALGAPFSVRNSPGKHAFSIGGTLLVDIDVIGEIDRETDVAKLTVVIVFVVSSLIFAAGLGVGYYLGRESGSRELK